MTLRLRPAACRLAVLLLCTSPAAHAADTLAARSCHVDGFETSVTCITLAVPRDYDMPDGPQLQLAAAIVPAVTGRPAADPLLVLAGGPGQSATSLGRILGPFFDAVRRERDVILFDVRGSGLSEAIECDPPKAGFSTDREAVHPAGIAAMRELGSCAARYGDAVRHHTSYEAVEDIERFRRARGYRQLSIWGGSYGTRIAQHYVRAYGEHVRAVVLDAVAPTGTSALATGAHAADIALERLLNRCADDPRCAQAFPRLPEQLDRLLASVAGAPMTVALADPISGVRGWAAFDYFTLSNAVRVALYSRTTTEVLPYAIDAADNGDFGPLVAMFGSPDESVSLGAQISMLCAEDVPLAGRGTLAERSGELMRDGYYEVFAQACEVWPADRLPEDMFAIFSADVPALAISGELDPATPPTLAEQALSQFSTGVHVVVPNAFHANSYNPCVARIAADFLRDPRAGGRDHACVDDTPSLNFFTGPRL